ncbi:MAG: PBECR2 nuclease fold domain-containing protein [Porcipelethomonas sp.]
MHFIGKIDIEKYKGICDGRIITDEVIITDNRVEHIIERRGREFYEEYEKFFPEIIADPDYIFKDDKVNTALVSKSFIHNGISVNLVLRLVVEGEDPNFKNSIITAVRENNKRFSQRLRNNIPVYKKLDKDE